MDNREVKILGISASPRREISNTSILLKDALSGAEQKGAKTEYIDLCSLKIEFCRACENCHKKIMACPIKDDALFLLNKILESDGIIFGSPVYLNHITGYLKTFLDRSSHFLHCHRLIGKYTAVVATSGGGPQYMVGDYIKEYSISCGAQYVGGVFTKIPITEEVKKQANELGKAIVDVIKEKKEFPEQIQKINSHKEYFKKIIENRKDDWIEEYQYYKDNGWL